HALDLITPNNALHGEKCAVGTILCACLQDQNWKVIKKVLKTIGAPTTADELGVGEKYIIEALVRAREVRPDRYTVLNIRMPDQKRAKEIARVTGVI
ncbi:MAG: NAD(P)-dependent glycerol-1-phosphate dehydrogenase, partial [Candidatus Bathyarchaeia archaeon]